MLSHAHKIRTAKDTTTKMSSNHIILNNVAEDESGGLERSASTNAILHALKEEEADIVDTITNALMGSRKLALVLFGILFATSICIVSLTGAAVYLIKDSSAENGMLVDKSSGEVLATASTFSVDRELTSESSLDHFAEVMRINMVFGEDEATQTYLSLIPTGFVKASCNATYVTCTSENTVYMFTNEGTIVYHGSDSYLADPSEKLQSLLGAHHPSLHAASKALLESPHHVHLTGWWSYFFPIVYRWVRRWVYEQGVGYVQEWVLEAAIDYYYSS